MAGFWGLKWFLFIRLEVPPTAGILKSVDSLFGDTHLILSGTVVRNGGKKK